MSAKSDGDLFLTVLDCSVRVRCRDRHAQNLLQRNFSFLLGAEDAPCLDYVVGRGEGAADFFIERKGRRSLTASNDSEFLFLFEKDLTIKLQRLRSDLYFLHSAAIEFAGKAVLLIAPSGSGKSTTTWALLHHGFGYLSDELSPVSLEIMEVHPYPHAICLKKKPPAPYLLPEQTLCTAQTIHVPTQLLPGKTCKKPARIAAVFFLTLSSRFFPAGVRPVSKAEATAHLFASALNPLAHGGEGLDGAVEIVKNNPCFELTTADLPATCGLVKRTVQSLFTEPGYTF